MLSSNLICSGAFPSAFMQIGADKDLPGLIEDSSPKNARSNMGSKTYNSFCFSSYNNSSSLVLSMTRLSYSELDSISIKVISCSYSHSSLQIKNDVIWSELNLTDSMRILCKSKKVDSESASMTNLKLSTSSEIKVNRYTII